MEQAVPQIPWGTISTIKKTNLKKKCFGTSTKRIKHKKKRKNMEKVLDMII